jgi:hypothetical protein
MDALKDAAKSRLAFATTPSAVLGSPHKLAAWALALPPISQFWLSFIVTGWLMAAMPPLKRIAHYSKRLLPTQSSTTATLLFVTNRVGFRAFYLFAVTLTGALLVATATGMLPPRVAAALRPIASHADAIVNADDDAADAAVDALLTLALLLTHVCVRLYETFFVHRFSGTVQSTFVLFGGLLYYVATPLTPLVDSPLLSLASNGGAAALLLGTAGRRRMCRWNVAAALLLFAVGQWQQAAAHRHLASLRARKDASSASSSSSSSSSSSLSPSSSSSTASNGAASGADAPQRYHIPHAGWFQYATAAHYTAEILIYIALAVARRGASSQLLALLFVVTNLSVTATGTHRWYEETFPVYKSLRRWVLLPGIW